MKILQYFLIISMVSIIYGNVQSEESELLTKKEKIYILQKLDELSRENAQLKSNVIKLEKLRQLESDTLRELGSDKLRNDMIHLQQKVSELENRCSSRNVSKRLLTEITDTTTVAFTATLDHHQILGPGQAVQYNVIITNIGNAYDPRHGHMIVPTKGIYLISVTMFNIVSDADYLTLVRNGNILVYFYAQASRHSPMTQTVVLSLEKGDVVWVKNTDRTGYSGHQLYGSKVDLYNTFTGYLLKST